MDCYDCGSGVWVGNTSACDRADVRSRFDRVIHIYRPSNLTHNLSCCYLMGGCHGELTVQWREGEPVAALEPGLDAIAAYAAGSGELLVHCLAGSCRSPHLAVVALLARGLDVGAAIAAVTVAGHRARKRSPDWQAESLTGILDWAAARDGGIA